MKKLYLILLMSLLLSACGSKIEGKTYSDPTCVTKFRFTSRGKGYASIPVVGYETEMRYAINGKKVTIYQQSLPNGNLVLTLRRDGVLEGVGGITFSHNKCRNK